MEKELILPIVHLNGTSRQELIEQRLEILTALRQVTAAFNKAMPNGRDYCPAGPDLLRKARTQHVRRLTVISDLIEEIERETDVLANNS